jgi:hypothetical protein
MMEAQDSVADREVPRTDRDVPPDASNVEVAARLEAALKGHLEHVASALAAARSPATEGRQAAGRSIYAPGSAAELDLHLPPATPLALDPLPSMLIRRESEEVALHDAPEIGEVDEEPEYAEVAEEAPQDEYEYAEEFGHAPLTESLTWLRESDDEDDDPLPAALVRHSPREAEPIAHLPPLVETARGISARTLAVAALFGLAAGVGAIAAYQFSVAPVAAPAVATSETRPAADTSRIAKLDADRVPQMAEEADVKVAAATAGSVVPKVAAAPAPSGTPVAAAVDVAPVTPAPAPLASAVETDAASASDDPVPPALRRTEDAGAAVAAAGEAPSDTEPFVATASIRRSPAKKASPDGEVLAYAPVPKPNDPVARSFFGKDDEADAAPASKKAASSAKIAPPSPGKAKVLMAVNMRAKPDNDAPSLKILGAGARVQVVSCDMWCLVVADGKRGYIFKKFLDN